MRLVLLGLASLLAAPGLPAQEAAPADTFEIGWTTTLDDVQTDLGMPIGTAFVATCSSDGSIVGVIWGTGTYTSDSSICQAAAHAGALTLADGGHAAVEVAAGQPEYIGTVRNGITSSPYPAWHASFRFPHAAPADTQDSLPHQLSGDWNTQARQIHGAVGSRARLACSAGGTGGNVWGTDVYTDDSSVCEAAVHAGVIERARGGTVLFELTGAQSSFQGSERNGVSSMGYPAWPGSFRFVEEEPRP